MGSGRIGWLVGIYFVGGIFVFIVGDIVGILYSVGRWNIWCWSFCMWIGIVCVVIWRCIYDYCIIVWIEGYWEGDLVWWIMWYWKR